MPPALGSGLAAELEKNNQSQKRGQNNKDDRKRKQVSFGDNVKDNNHCISERGRGKGHKGGKGKKGGKRKNRGRIGQLAHEPALANNDYEGEEDDDDDYNEDEEEEMIGKRRKGRKGKNNSDEEEEEDEENHFRRVGDEELSGEESDGDHNFNDAGEVMEAFNLKEEREQGHFDEAGNYVWRKTEDISDEWLQSMGGEAGMEAAIGQAAAAQRRQRRELAAKEASSKQGREKGILELLQELHSYLLEEETIVQAMKRFSPPKKLTKPQQHQLDKKKFTKNMNNRNHPKQEKVIHELSAEELKEVKLKFSMLTEVSDKLLSGGVVNIYQMNKEDIEAKMKELEQVNTTLMQFTSHTSGELQGSSEAIPSSVVAWEYMGADGAIYGPYSNEMMMAWRMQGFFTGESAVMMRQCSSSSIEETPKQTKTSTSEPENNVDDLMADFDDSDDEDEVSQKATHLSSFNNSTVEEETMKKHSAGAFGGGLLDSMNTPNEDDEDDKTSRVKKMKIDIIEQKETQQAPWKLSDTINFQCYC